MTTETRKSYFKLDQNYVYTNVCLLKSIEIFKQDDCPLFSLSINGIIIDPSLATKTSYIWNASDVRNILRNDFDNNNYIKLESTLTYNSLKALDYYSEVDNDLFQDCFFTKELLIQLHPSSGKAPFFEAQETVYKSDASKAVN